MWWLNRFEVGSPKGWAAARYRGRSAGPSQALASRMFQDDEVRYLDRPTYGHGDIDRLLPLARDGSAMDRRLRTGRRCLPAPVMIYIPPTVAPTRLRHGTSPPRHVSARKGEALLVR